MLTFRRNLPHRRSLSALLAALVLSGSLAPAAMPAFAQQPTPAPEAPAAPPAPAPAAQAPAGQAPAGQAPAAQAPADQAPAGQAPAGQAPAATPSTVAPASPPSPAAPQAPDPLVPPLSPSGTAPAGSAAPEGGETAAPATGPDGTPVAGENAVDPAIHAEDPSVAAQLPHDLSPWGMFMAADWIVKGVMIGLAFASVVTWTVWLAKTVELAFAKGRLRRALKGYLAAASLEEARNSGPAGPAGTMLKTTLVELKRSGELPADGIKERVAVSLSRIEVAAGRSITRGTGLLATIGATAPFVGLFGTVWGIMNSFIGISRAQTTNLAVVAPGIAEALLATAIGLVAAIPAVVIYNHFSRQVSGYRLLLGDASAEVLRLLSRDLDRRDAAKAGGARSDAARLRATAAAE